MRAALLIARKDVVLRIRDRSAIIWGVLAPLGLAAVFSLVLSGAAAGPVDVTFGVADEDGTATAAGLVGALQELDAEGVFDVETVDDSAGAETRVAEGDLDALIVIPAGFGRAVGSGEAVSLEVVGYVDSPIASQVAASVAGAFADEINGVSVAVQTRFAVTGAAPAPGDVDAAVRAASQTSSPLALETETETSKQLDTATFYAAGMAVFFLFFTVQFGVVGLLEERSQGTLPRLLAAPIGRSSIIAGKALTSFVLGVSSMAILIVATTLLPFMDASWGDSIGVALLVLAGVFSAMGVMTVVAAFARTPETAGSIQAVIAFLLGMLGGAFFPLSQVGGFVARLNLLTPHAWFLRGLGDLAGGGSAVDVLPEVGAILLFGAVTVAVASIRLRRAVAV